MAKKAKDDAPEVLDAGITKAAKKAVTWLVKWDSDGGYLLKLAEALVKDLAGYEMKGLILNQIIAQINQGMGWETAPEDPRLAASMYAKRAVVKKIILVHRRLPETYATVAERLGRPNLTRVDASRLATCLRNEPDNGTAVKAFFAPKAAAEKLSGVALAKKIASNASKALSKVKTTSTECNQMIDAINAAIAAFDAR